MPNYNIWEDWLEDFPRALYGASIPGGTRPFEEYWQGQFGGVYGQYETALGRQAMAGMPPSLSFAEFLKPYQFEREYGLLSPTQRGLRQPQQLTWRV